MKHRIEKEIKDFGDYIKHHQSDGIVIYGAGIRGKKLFLWLQENNIKVKEFCVTEKNSQDKDLLLGKAVREFNLLVQEKIEYLFLIAVRHPLNKEIESNMEKYGISNYVDIPEYLWEIISDETFFFPTLEITPKIGCSIHCKYCPQDLLVKKYLIDNSVMEMSYDSFKLCIDKTPGNLIIDFSGFVEPFLAKDTIQMIQYADAIGRDVRVYTTLVGLNIETFKMIEQISFKQFVLHLPDQYHYANIPITFEYLNLLEYVLSIKKQDGSPLVTGATSQEKPPMEILEVIGNRVRVHWELIDRAGNLDNSDGKLAHGQSNFGGSYCCRSNNLNHNVLLPNGDVYLCCMDFGLRHRLGNLLEQSYSEIYQGREHKKIKKSLECGGKGALCATCTAIREYNRKMEP